MTEKIEQHPDHELRRDFKKFMRALRRALMMFAGLLLKIDKGEDV